LFDLIRLLFNIGLWAAWVAAGLGLLFAATLGPWARLLPRPARALGAAAGIALAMFAAGHIHGVTQAKTSVSQLERELAVAREQARELSADAQARAVRVDQLQAEVTSYEVSLARGDTTACPADSNYTERLQQILRD